MVPGGERLPRFSVFETAAVPFETAAVPFETAAVPFGKPEVFYKFFFLYTKYSPIPVSTIR